MTTFLTLKTGLARDLRDPSTGGAFSDAELGDLINEAITEISDLAPLQYQEDITVVADTLRYGLRTGVAGVANSPQIYLNRVEVWDSSYTPDRFVARLAPSSEVSANQSDAGWRTWGGYLEVPNSVEQALVVGTHVLRTWGYSPYKPLSGDTDVTDVPSDLEWAVRECGAARAAERLLNDRSLFQQWQTANHNSDASIAALLGVLSAKRSNWERRRRQLYAMRQGA